LKSLTENYLKECRESLASEQEQSLAATDSWSHVDKPEAHADWDVLYKKLAVLVGNASPEDADVQVLIRQHFAIASRFYIPTKLAYVGLGLFYRENADMRHFHNTYHPGMAEFLELALRSYALRNL
jgi:hypothetical protein